MVVCNSFLKKFKCLEETNTFISNFIEHDHLFYWEVPRCIDVEKFHSEFFSKIPDKIKNDENMEICKDSTTKKSFNLFQRQVLKEFKLLTNLLIILNVTKDTTD